MLGGPVRRLAIDDERRLPCSSMRGHQPAIDSPTTEPAHVSRTTRRGLWCYSCHRPTRFELDVISCGDPVITMQGCPACRTGLCQEVVA